MPISKFVTLFGTTSFQVSNSLAIDRASCVVPSLKQIFGNVVCAMICWLCKKRDTPPPTSYLDSLSRAGMMSGRYPYLWICDFETTGRMQQDAAGRLPARVGIGSNRLQASPRKPVLLAGFLWVLSRLGKAQWLACRSGMPCEGGHPELPRPADQSHPLTVS
jgi:hypothetical protein